MNPHISDLLPEFVNGTLDQPAMVSVRAHLRICRDCRVSLAAWRAVSDATKELAHFERWAPETERISVVAMAQSQRSPLLSEERMSAGTLTFPSSITTTKIGGRGRRRIRWTPLNRGLEIVAALLVIAVLGAGYFAYQNGSPNGGSSSTSVPGVGLAATPPAAWTDECAVTPRTAADFARVLGNVETNGVPDVAVIPPFNKLPEGSPVDLDTRKQLDQIWSSYWACDRVGDRLGAYGVLTDDAIARVFFRSSFATNAVWGDPVVDASGTPTPLTEKPKWRAPFLLGDGVVMSDGRIFMYLTTGTTADQNGFTGDVVFVHQDDSWLIDDFTIFQG